MPGGALPLRKVEECYARGPQPPRKVEECYARGALPLRKVEECYARGPLPLRKVEECYARGGPAPEKSRGMLCQGGPAPEKSRGMLCQAMPPRCPPPSIPRHHQPISAPVDGHPGLAMCSITMAVSRHPHQIISGQPGASLQKPDLSIVID